MSGLLFQSWGFAFSKQIIIFEIFHSISMQKMYYSTFCISYFFKIFCFVLSKNDFHCNCSHMHISRLKAADKPLISRSIYNIEPLDFERLISGFWAAYQRLIVKLSTNEISSSEHGSKNGVKTHNNFFHIAQTYIYHPLKAFFTKMFHYESMSVWKSWNDKIQKGCK